MLKIRKISINSCFENMLMMWSSALDLENHEKVARDWLLGLACHVASRRCSSAGCKYCCASSCWDTRAICCMLGTLLIYLSFAFVFHSDANYYSWQMVKVCLLIHHQMCCWWVWWWWWWRLHVNQNIVTDNWDYRNVSFSFYNHYYKEKLVWKIPSIC